MQEPHVLIVGAGITGLLIAHGLQQAGIKYTIFEAEDAGQRRPKEWTMGIHWALPLLEGLLPPHLAARIAHDASADASLNYEEPPNKGAYIFDGVTGEVLKDLTVPGRNVRVSRRKLRALCMKGVEVLHGFALDSVSCDEDAKTVTATFTNGQSYRGTLLVGADGPRSAVRNYLFASAPAEAEAEALQDGITTSMVIAYSDPEMARLVRSKTHPVWCMCIHPKMLNFMSIQDIVDPDVPETWRFFFLARWLGEKFEGARDADILREVKARAAEHAEDMLYWVARPWDAHRGLVTLAGDAAHPMPPFRGQGGNHAIQDAHNFVEAVKRITEGSDSQTKDTFQSGVIKEYSDEVARRGSEETLLTLKNGTMMMQYHNFKESPYMKQGLSRGGN